MKDRFKIGIVSLFMILVVMAPSALAQIDMDETWEFGINIRSNHSGKCLKVAGSTEDMKKNGQVIKQQECNSEDGRLWILDCDEQDYCRIISKYSGKCLDVQGRSEEKGADVQQWTCVLTNNENQLWRLECNEDNDDCRIVAVHSQKCLDIRNNSTQGGGYIHQWTCDPSDNSQSWRLEPVVNKLEIKIRNEVSFTDGIPSDFPVEELALSYGEGTHVVSGEIELSAPELIEDKIEECFYQLVGWQGTGSVPESGFGQPGTVNITENSTINWKYRKVHRLTLGLDPADILGDNSGQTDTGIIPGINFITDPDNPKKEDADLILYPGAVFYPPYTQIHITTPTHLEIAGEEEPPRCAGYSVADGSVTGPVLQEKETVWRGVGPMANKALLFDGEDDKIKTGANIDQTENSEGVTFEAWVYPMSHAGSSYLEVISSDNGGYDWSLGHKEGKWHVMNGSAHVATNLAVDLNQWQHVAAVFDPEQSRIQVYKNGVAALEDIAIGYTDDNSPIFIGGNPTEGGGPHFFHGGIDEVRIWGTARTSEEIASKMSNRLKGDEARLIAYYDFDNLQRFKYFDGEDDIVRTNVEISQTEDSKGVTFEAWAYPMPSQDERSIVISSDDGGYDWSIAHNGKKWIVYNGTYQETVFDVELNKWQHVAAVFEPGIGVRFYKNGSEQFISDISYDENSNSIAIGDNPGPWNDRFRGYIDAARIWEGQRTAEEIVSSMNARRASDEENLLASYDFDDADGSIALDLSANGNHGVLLNMTADDWVSSGAISDNNYDPIVWRDKGPMANQQSNLDGLVDGALYFDGVNDRIETDVMINQSAESTGVTFEAWVYPGSDAGSSYLEVISSDNGGYDWSLGHRGGKWHVMNGSAHVATDLAVDVNQWQHVAAVFDPEQSRIQVYKNGVADLEEIAIGYTNDNSPIFIGGNPTEGGRPHFFHGGIDEVRIWGVARTGEEIVSNMSNRLKGDEAGLSAYYDFDELPKVRYFDGVDDKVATNVQIDQSADSPGATLEAWVYPMSDEEGYRAVISSDDEGYDWGISQRGDTWTIISGESFLLTKFKVELNKWQHLAAVFEPGVGTVFYKNGEEESFEEIGYDDSTTPIMIGKHGSERWDDYFNGAIDAVRIWDVPRTKEQIVSSMDARPASDATNLLAAYYFNSGDRFILPDISVNGHDGMPRDMTADSWMVSTALAGSGDVSMNESIQVLSFSMSANANIEWVYRDAPEYIVNAADDSDNAAFDAPEGTRDDWDYTENIEIKGTYPTDTAKNSFYWEKDGNGNGRLYAIKPIPYFEIHWNDNDNTVTRGSAVWPDETDRTTTVDATVYLQPASANYTFVGMMWSDSYVDDEGIYSPPEALTPPDDDDTDTTPQNSDREPVFAPPKAGKSLLQFKKDNGELVWMVVDALPLKIEEVAEGPDSAVGEPIEPAEGLHDDPENRNGFVYNKLSYYDGFGKEKAHDRYSRKGPIIPVNASPSPGDDFADDYANARQMIVSWYETDQKTGIAWPAREKARRYKCVWPEETDTIDIASEEGSGELAPHEYNGIIYYQNDPDAPGFNPNEEHALVIGKTLYAIRNDLNAIDGETTSEPYVILKYEDPATEEWRMRIFEVIVGEDGFEYNKKVATPILPPMPLSFMPLAENPASYPESGEDYYYTDHKGTHWARAAAVSGENEPAESEIVMKWYYPLQTGFYYPDYDNDGEPDAEPGDDVAFLNGGQAHDDPPRNVVYSTKWPDDAVWGDNATEVPVLNIGETLTEAKYGLPEVVNWASGEIIYDENVYKQGGPLAKLFDPFTPRKVDLPELPEGIKKDKRSGKVWFPDLPYAIRSRLFYNTTSKTLNFQGLSIDTGLGDPLLLPNIMSIAERDQIIALDSAWSGTVESLFSKTRNPRNIQLGQNEEQKNPYHPDNAARSFADPEAFLEMWGILLGLRSAGGEDPQTEEEKRIVSERIVGLSMALTAGSADGEGYLVLAENDDESMGGAQVKLHVIRVEGGPYQGEIKVIEPDNVFDDRLTLRHSGDFAGEPEKFYFQWYYQPDNSGLSPDLPEGSKTGGWTLYDEGAGLNQITLKGPGLMVLSDNWFVARYYYGDHPQVEGGIAYPALVDEDPAGDEYWSEWAGAPGNETAQLAEGWVKRFMSAFNLYDARVTDFYLYPAATMVDIISQLGPKYEGDIAYNASPDNLNSVGLIESYQTVRNDTIDFGPGQGYDYGPVNNAILLITTKLANFYGILGNEAYIDAKDPTIGFDTKSDEVGQMATSLFAFKNQTASLLEEELTLLRGRDSTFGTTRARPVYNRFIWNFTEDDGELAYVQTYNIPDRDVSGVIDEMDAKILYPQGHGDAWGHYLTAMKMWYELLQHDHITWEPRSESVMVAGAPVAVDYFDERNFAKTAAAKAHVGWEIIDLTYRDKYVSDPDGQWKGYRDTDPERAWGLDGWARRIGQGAYFDWVTATAIIPAADPDPDATGILKIDRSTVSELRNIATENETIQSKVDQADQGMNPLGLVKGVVPFDIDPHTVTSNDPDSFETKTHFEQIYDRALRSLNNAAVTFDYATDYTLRLRGNKDRLVEFRRSVEEKEREFTNQLIGIFGYPYEGDIGPGGTYRSGYEGPDLFHYMYMDLPELTGGSENMNNVLDDQVAWTITFDYQRNIVEDGVDYILEKIGLDNMDFISDAINLSGIGYILDEIEFNDKEGDGDVQFKSIFQENCDDETNDCIAEIRYYMDEDNPWFQAPAGWDKRRAPGEIQTTLSGLIKAHADYQRGLRELEAIIGGIDAALDTLEAKYNVLAHQIIVKSHTGLAITSLNNLIAQIDTARITLKRVAAIANAIKEIVITGIPDSFGFSNDAASLAQAAVEAAGGGTAMAANIMGDLYEIGKIWKSWGKEEISLSSDLQLAVNDARYEVQQMILQLETMEGDARIKLLELYGLRETIQKTLGQFNALVAKGERLMSRREVFRKRTAGIIQDYRYQDMAFREFRNSAVEKYWTAFNLAARYAYMAAAACDYDTTMLDPETEMGAAYYDTIVRQRSLGTIINGKPTTGDTGLSDPLATMSMAYDVYKGQLGLNNPVGEINTFSLRRELFRIKDDAAKWQKKLRQYLVTDVTRFTPFTQYCRMDDILDSEPAIAIPFSSRITHGDNFFGWPLGASDSTLDSSSFATKIRSAAVLFENYDAAGLTATPRVFLIPVGADVQRVVGAQGDVRRQWKVVDQKLPVPLALSQSTLEANQETMIIDLMTEYGDYRKFSALRAFPDTAGFQPGEYTMNSRLVGRSAWNTQWQLIIPGGKLLHDPDEGLEKFIENVTDIKLVFQTYSYSGNR